MFKKEIFETADNSSSIIEYILFFIKDNKYIQDSLR